MKACEENKCKNKGICKDLGNYDDSCLCPVGFSGKYCESKSILSINILLVGLVNILIDTQIIIIF